MGIIGAPVARGAPARARPSARRGVGRGPRASSTTTGGA